MNILEVSDLHFEFHHDQGMGFARNLPNQGVDLLILAGDITTARTGYDAVRVLCDRFPFTLYIPGNHEYYNAGVGRITDNLRELETKASNLKTFPEPAVYEYKKKRFIAGTLWFEEPFDYSEKAAQRYLNDFRVIKNFEPWVYDQNTLAIQLLDKELQEGDIVVTHHTPSMKSCPPQFLNDDGMNHYYHNKLDTLVTRKKPKYWFHGHTHTSFDYTLGSTRVLCNPYGYLGHEWNVAFNENKTVNA